MKRLIVLSLALATCLSFAQTRPFNSPPIPNYGAYVTAATAASTYAPKASPVLTGQVTAGSSASIGNSPQGGIGLYLQGGVAGGGTNAHGIYASPIGQTVATNVTSAFTAVPATSASVYNTTDVVGLWAQAASLGSGSTATSTEGVLISDQVGGTNNFGLRSLVSSGSAKWNIYASGTAQNAFAGNVAIGSTTAPATALAVTGAAAVSGAITAPGLATSSAATTGTVCWTTGTGNFTVDTTLACLSSTARVKRNIQPLNVGLKEVMALRPVSYDLKPEFNPEHLGHQVGLIAEEVGKTDDRLIAVDDDGLPRGVRYMQLTAVLVKAIQDQQAEIQLLQKQVKNLRH